MILKNDMVNKIQTPMLLQSSSIVKGKELRRNAHLILRPINLVP